MTKLFQPFISAESRRLVYDTLRGIQLAEGPRVKQFEREFGQKFHLNNVVAVNSGTTALELAYELSGISVGDEVITPVLTCTATNIPLVRRGAKIIFADTDYDLNVDVEDVKKKITDKTKAIVFVHFGGNNRGLRDLVAICRKRGITLIEDAAQAVGSETWGLARFTCVSLQAIKTLTSGDGGFLVCRNWHDYTKAKKLRWFGYDREKKHKHGDIDLDLAGYKYHMNDITASIGLGNLHYIDKILKHREALRKIYKKAGLFAHSWLAGAFTINLPVLQKHFADNGVEIGQHHYRNDKYSIFGGRQKLPHMNQIEEQYFFVPFHYGVSLSAARKIVELCSHPSVFKR